MNRNYVDCMYRLSNIKRYSTHLINHIQNVSTHTFNVIGLCIEAARKDNPSLDMALLLQKAYYHDFGEGMIGDVPATTRNHNETIHSEIKRIEEIMLEDVLKDDKMDFTELARDAKKGPEGELIALVDIVERLLYIIQEKRSGNGTLDTVYGHTIKQLKDDKYKRLLKQYPTIKEKVKTYATEWKED